MGHNQVGNIPFFMMEIDAIFHLFSLLFNEFTEQKVYHSNLHQL